jgi:hypothetical protein
MEVPHTTKGRGSFWWKDVLKLCEVFRGIAMCKVVDGTTILFRSGVWNDHLLQNKFHRLYSFVKNKNVSVAQFLLNNMIEEQFHLPLSIPAYQEYQEMQQIIQQIQISNTKRGTWQYI